MTSAIRVVLIAQVVLATALGVAITGCSGSSERPEATPTVDTCGEVRYAPETNLPPAYTPCHWERARSRSSVRLTGPHQAAAAPGVVWWEPDFGARIRVGVTYPPLPGLRTGTSFNDFGVRLRVTSVETVDGAELFDPEGAFNEEHFELLRTTMAEPSNYSARHIQAGGNFGDVYFGARSATLIAGASPARAHRVRGILTLRVPLDIQYVRLRVDAPATAVPGGTLVARRDNDRVAVEYSDGVAFVDFRARGDESSNQSCFGSTRKVSCELPSDTEEVVVAVAAEVVDQVTPFIIEPATSAP